MGILSIQKLKLILKTSIHRVLEYFKSQKVQLSLGKKDTKWERTHRNWAGKAEMKSR